MRLLLKVILFATASVMILCAALFVAVRFMLFPHPCDRFETMLSRDAEGRSVEYVFEACTTIGTDTEGWVDLISASGNRIHIFTFEPWGGEISHKGVRVKGPFEPAATWIGRNELRISIGTVGRVLQRQSQVDGIRVSYAIGLELYKQ